MDAQSAFLRSLGVEFLRSGHRRWPDEVKAQAVAKRQEAVAAVLRERDALREDNKRLEHLIAELFETAKINGIERFAYLKATLEVIANAPPQIRIDDLLPWNFKLSS